MNISTDAIVSSTDIIKNYKFCREKAELLGKVFVLKNNQPDAVLFSVSEYERLSKLLEYIESLDDIDIDKAIESLPLEGKRKSYTMNQLENDLESSATSAK
ncbi:MAG: type II toxin-antitoxin system Phd/YefM family antitoxin [Actinobacteria bacterium]|nr:type II toxin-antitoxin system Phd/YefM family antitoxin [Actinomycetota bacterium]